MATQIKTITELDEVLEKLVTPLEYGLPSLGERADRNTTNELFSEIENALNALYVKTRLLEDLNSFAETYIQEEFKKNSAEFESTIKQIRESADQLLNSKKLSESVTFSMNDRQTTDRDGSPLPTASNIRGNLIPASEVIATAKPGNITVESNAIPYRRNLTPIDHYRTFYCEEAQRSEPIRETIRVLFMEDVDSNFAFISSFKSNIKAFYYIKAETNELIALDIDNVISFPEEKIKGFVVILEGNSYDPVEYEVLDFDKESGYNELLATASEPLLGTIFDTLTAKVGG